MGLGRVGDMSIFQYSIRDAQGSVDMPGGREKSASTFNTLLEMQPRYAMDVSVEFDCGTFNTLLEMPQTLKARRSRNLDSFNTLLEMPAGGLRRSCRSPARPLSFNTLLEML